MSQFLAEETRLAKETIRDIRTARLQEAARPPRESVRPWCPSLLDRLRERKIVQWTVAYFALAWLVLQLMDVLSEIWGWSIKFQQVVSLLLGFGVLPMLVVAWFHGEKGHQDICPMEAAIVAATIMGSVFAVWSFCLGSI
jgi:hypothetical protein